MNKIPEPLPPNWAKGTLGDLLPLTYGKGLTKKTRNTEGDVPVYGSSGVVGHHDEGLTKGATIIVGRKGNVGEVHFSSSACWPIDTVYFSEPTPSTNLKFFCHLLRYINLKELDKSTAIPGLSRDDYNAVEVAVPPLLEQQSIVETIDVEFSKLDEAVLMLNRVQANLKRYRASVLKAAVEGSLVPTEASLACEENRNYEPASVLLERILKERRRRWEEDELAKMEAKGKSPKNDKWKAKYKEPVAPDTSELPELPEGWCWASVDQLAGLDSRSLTDGPFGSNLKTAHYTETGPRVVRLQNIGDGLFKDVKAHISENHYQSLVKHAVFPGDIVISSLGEELPRACIIPEKLGPAIVKADCLRFSPNRQMAHASYLMYALNSKPTRKRTESMIHGVGRPRIGLTLLRGLALPIPPIAEQERILAEIEKSLTVAMHAATDIDQQLERCQRLRQAILKSAFEGKLVEQDPRDEPAVDLLQRIKAEREELGKPNSKHGKRQLRTKSTTTKSK